MAEAALKDRNGRPDSEQNLSVVVRVRPINEDEIITGATPIAHKVDNGMVVLMDPLEDPDDVLRANRSREKQFTFDMAFDGSAAQKEVYESTCKLLIPSVINGYNATVFAYGATGAGKTYTMLGKDDDEGIMARAVNDLFTEMSKAMEELTYKVSMSYLEIYNEMIRDLLNPNSGYLDLREDSKGVQVAGLSEFTAKSTREVMEILVQGNLERTQEPTAANKTSSRSHAVLQITVKQRDRVRGSKNQVRIGRLFLIDLAGSERAANTLNRGKRMVEGAHINRSLLALGNCINALSDKNAARYVNYRDSKLTRLLKDALGGNCKTVMVANISPASVHFEESRNTLVYADRAKNIKTKVRRNVLDVNYHITQYTNIIAEMREEIKRLREKLHTNDRAASMYDRVSDSKKSGEMHRIKSALLKVFRDQMDLRKTLMEVNNTSMEISLETARNQLIIRKWERERALKKKDSQDDDEEVKYKEEEKGKLFLTEEERKEGDTDSLVEPDEVRAAREELASLGEERKQSERIKSNVRKELENSKEKAAKIERMLPSKVKNEEQEEILSLLCKIHELEVENMELQSSCLLRNFEIHKKDMVIAQYDEHHNLCDEIIHHQRALIDLHKIEVPRDLDEAYEQYQLEVGGFDMSARNLVLPEIQFHKVKSQLSIGRKHETDSYSDWPDKLSTVGENERLQLPRLNPPGASTSLIRKQVLKKSSNNLAKYEDHEKSLFSRSSKAKEIRERQEVEETMKKSPRPAHNQPVRQQSIITLSSRSAISSPTPPVEDPSKLYAIEDLNSPRLKPKTEQQKYIASNTRSIAALAAKRKNLVQLDSNSSDRFDMNDAILNRTYTNLTVDNNNNKDTDSYLSKSRLEAHNKSYGSADSLDQLLREDELLLERRSMVIDNNKVKPKVAGRSLYRNTTKKAPGLYTVEQNSPRRNKNKKRSRSQEYASYNQMTPEAFFKQLAKTSPRKVPGAQNNPQTTNSRNVNAGKKSRLPAPLKSRQTLDPFGDEFDNKSSHNVLPRHRPLVKKNAATKATNPTSSQEPALTPAKNHSKSKPGQFSSIPAYRKGDFGITGTGFN